MDKTKLRGLDFLFGLFFVVFSIWGFTETFKMPMKETYGGVANVWYVSPALFPLIVNGGLLILGAVLLIFAVKQGGPAGVRMFISEKRGAGISERTMKFLFIILFICGLAYVFLPNIDFYLSMTLFLLLFISAFYFEDMRLLKINGLSYLGITALLLILKFTGLMSGLNKLFDYTTDVLVLIFLAVMARVVAVSVRTEAERSKKLRRVFITAFLSPLILIIVFRFLLLIPMPKEGGIMDLMYLVYYSFK